MLTISKWPFMACAKGIFEPFEHAVSTSLPNYSSIRGPHRFLPLYSITPRHFSFCTDKFRSGITNPKSHFIPGYSDWLDFPPPVICVELENYCTFFVNDQRQCAVLSLVTYCIDSITHKERKVKRIPHHSPTRIHLTRRRKPWWWPF